MQYKPVIIGGDMSVAHDKIDLAEPDDNHRHAGFTGIERKNSLNYWMPALLILSATSTQMKQSILTGAIAKMLEQRILAGD